MACEIKTSLSIMYDISRDSPFGQCMRLLSHNRLYGYPEEQSGFHLSAKHSRSSSHHQTSSGERSRKRDESVFETNGTDFNCRTNIAPNVVTWYSDSDPANPQNWSMIKKSWVSFVILMYTFAIYIGSSLYTSSTKDVAQRFGVSDIAASLGLSLYVVEYGIGPLLWSPLSEIPSIGRNAPYIITFFLFVVLCIPMIFVDNFAGVLILRILLGFFGSPALATGGASYGDFCNGEQMTYMIALWGGGATLAPSLGPVVSGFAVQKEDWRWGSWELLWISGPAFIVMFLAFPETSHGRILFDRARRLRKSSGRSDINAEFEVKQSHLSAVQIAFDALLKPWEINIKDPAMLFATVYTSLIYACYYSFFESFPLVYEGTYGWSLGETGLAFLAVLVGLLIAVVSYCSYFYFLAGPMIARKEAREPGSVQPEERLWPGLVATFFIPIGLFIFAWTARSSVFWLASLVGIAMSMIGIFIITVCMLSYIPFTYPRFAGSLLAANGFARAVFAAGAILFAQPMFKTLGVPGGVSLLGGLSLLCCGGFYILVFWGKNLRKRSRFAAS